MSLYCGGPFVNRHSQITLSTKEISISFEAMGPGFDGILITKLSNKVKARAPVRTNFHFRVRGGAARVWIEGLLHLLNQ